jgi:pimeloyl-ACP methyl ester carboxylesterase
MNKETIDGYDLTYSEGAVFQTADGAQLYYELRGPENAPLLTILNNYFVIAPIWRNFTGRVAEKFRILTYDLRNQGASTRVTGDLTFAQHVADLDELHHYLGVEQTYLLGTSTSCLIARDYAHQYPERVGGMTLVGPVFNPYGDRRRKALTKSWLNSLDAGGPKALFAHIYPLIYADRTIESGGSATYLALRERFLALNSHIQLEINLKASLTVGDDPDQLRRIYCPTVIVTGAADFLASPQSSTAAAALLPNGRAVVIPGAGHVPYFEATDDFETTLIEFMREIERSKHQVGVV